MVFSQGEFAINCEWGLRGLKELAPTSQVIIIVDVLSFTTAVDIATARGAVVFPYPLKGESAAAFAETVQAETASSGRRNGFSLSPASLLEVPPGHRLVLPSPNGAALSFASGHPVVFAACLRNAAAVARMAMRSGSPSPLSPPERPGTPANFVPVSRT